MLDGTYFVLFEGGPICRKLWASRRARSRTGMGLRFLGVTQNHSSELVLLGSVLLVVHAPERPTGEYLSSTFEKPAQLSAVQLPPPLTGLLSDPLYCMGYESNPS